MHKQYAQRLKKLCTIAYSKNNNKYYYDNKNMYKEDLETQDRGSWRKLSKVNEIIFYYHL